MVNIQRNLLLIFSMAILMIVVLAVMAAFNAIEQFDSTRLRDESNQRVSLLEDLQELLFQAESSQRAYAATGTEIFLEEHQGRRREVANLIERLRSVGFSGDEGGDRSLRLLDAVARRVAIMDRVNQMRAEEGAAAAAALISSLQGKTTMDEVVAITESLIAGERDVLVESEQRLDFSGARLVYLLSGAALLSLLLLGGAFMVTRSELRRNHRLAASLQQSQAEIAMVNDLSSSLQSCQSREEAASVLNHYMCLLFPGIPGAVYLMKASRNLLELAASWPVEEQGFAVSMQPQDCWALRLGRIYEIRSRSEDMVCSHLAPDQQSSLCAPLLAQGEIIGMLHMFLLNDQGHAEVRRRAQFVATHTSAALGGILLREALRHQSVRDPLTSLYNRRYLEESMEREVLKAIRTVGSFGVIMVDIDHFKKFNDDHGHQAGDHLLKEFANHLRLHVRGDDIACRYGGEEFLLLISGATIEQAQTRAETLRQSLHSLVVQFRGQRLPAVTASLGVAGFPGHGNDWEAIIHLADAALYQAKRKGRDCVVVADL